MAGRLLVEDEADFQDLESIDLFDREDLAVVLLGHIVAVAQG